MKLSTKTKNAVAILSYMLCFSEKRNVSLTELEAKIGISSGYSAQILSALKKGGIVFSKMGVGGGYYITKETADELTLGDVCVITEENMHVVKCAFDVNGCDLGKDIYTCPARDLLCDISDFIFGSLDSILIKDISFELINNGFTDKNSKEEMYNENVSEKQIWNSWLD